MRQYGKFNSVKVYYVDGHAFVSDKQSDKLLLGDKWRLGIAKAREYAQTHFIPYQDIIVFDSDMEYQFYKYLLGLRDTGYVKDIRFHVMFPLLKSFDSNSGMHHNALDYEADFTFVLCKDIEMFGKAGSFQVIDVKGFIEDTFVIKWAMFDSLYASRGWSLRCFRGRGSKGIYYNWEEVRMNTGVHKKKKTVEKLREENRILKRNEAERRKEERKAQRELDALSKLDALPKRTKAQEKKFLLLKEKVSKIPPSLEKRDGD